MKSLAVAICLAAVPLATAAQTHQQSYAGQHQREIKALSAEEIAQYQSGAGMGYAKAAELNGFPGPMHVLELADKLALSAQQRDDTRRLMDAHKAQAREIGARRVEAENRLDGIFRGGGVNEAAMADAVRAAAAIEGEYRLSHLETHRRMRLLLGDEQVARYASLRGYATGGSSGQHGKH